MPSETSREMMRAVARSQGSDSATKSPKEDIRSAPISQKFSMKNQKKIAQNLNTNRVHGHMPTPEGLKVP
jgi:hypothetical protein